MGQYSIQSIVSSLVIFLFFVVGFTSIIHTQVTEYNVLTNPVTGIDYTDFQDNLSVVIDSSEESAGTRVATETDAEGLLGVINTLNNLIQSRDVLSNAKTRTETNIYYVPLEVWALIGALITIIITIIIAVALWRYDGGIRN